MKLWGSICILAGPSECSGNITHLWILLVHFVQSERNSLLFNSCLSYAISRLALRCSAAYIQKFSASLAPHITTLVVHGKQVMCTEVWNSTAWDGLVYLHFDGVCLAWLDFYSLLFKMLCSAFQRAYVYLLSQKSASVWLVGFALTSWIFTHLFSIFLDKLLFSTIYLC